MKKSGSNKKVANSLVAVSCGAVLAVYTAGYARTRAAADRFDAQTVERRAAAPDLSRTATPPEEVRPAITRAEVASGAAVSPAPAREAARRFNPNAVPVQATIETPASLSEPPALSAPSQAAVPGPAASAPVLAAPLPEPKVEAIVAPPPAAPKWKDGTYYGWGTSRHGDIQAQVVVEGGRIAAATISQCRTRYPCSVIETLPPEVAQRQSPEVDYISRATQSTNAFYYAVVEALNKAK